MKYVFTFVFLIGLSSLQAQSNQVNSLPEGKYETMMEASKTKWEKGDIILLDQNKYRLSSNNEVGEYKFSVSAQRVFFTSGPLKNYFAKTIVSPKGPSILLPYSENQQSELKVTDNVTAFLKH